MTKYKIVGILSLLGLILGCEKEDLDLCHNGRLVDCHGLYNIDISKCKTSISPHSIEDFTINPVNPDEIAFIGIPEGFQDRGLFVLKVGSGTIRRIALCVPGFRYQPDWGETGKILFPFSDNYITSDGNQTGKIKGCPTGFGNYPKWAKGDSVLLGQAENDHGELVLVSVSASSGNYVTSCIFEPRFRANNSGTKLVSTIPSNRLKFLDIPTCVSSEMPLQGMLVRGGDWLPDNESLVYITEKERTNECGLSIPESQLRSINVRTGKQEVLLEACNNEPFLDVQVSEDGRWIYLLVRTIEWSSNDSAIFHSSIWRTNLVDAPVFVVQ